MITPAVGRVVLYQPCKSGKTKFGDQPFAATVVFVHNDRLVNLVVYDHGGIGYGAMNVPLVQEGDQPPLGVPWCHWMPYQLGQAAKTEAAEKTALELGAEVRRAGLAGP